jgi:hypothetical protein
MKIAALPDKVGSNFVHYAELARIKPPSGGFCVSQAPAGRKCGALSVRTRTPEPCLPAGRGTRASRRGSEAVPRQNFLTKKF